MTGHILRPLPPPREILTVAQMTAADRQAIEAGASGAELMERAGAAVADAVIARFPVHPTVVLAGPGNNGGDGYVIARRLHESGWPVRIEALTPPENPRRDQGEGSVEWRDQAIVPTPRSGGTCHRRLVWRWP